MNSVALIRREIVPQRRSRMIEDLCAILRREVREGRLRVIREDRVERCDGNERREWRYEG